ncbi:MAG: hypothetical protein JO287_24630, partial [Pseudonocardiales bacterium]|nr:hypothetical protein [Pseudonocardiales bacterium]
LDQTHGTRDPAARYAPPERRLAALTAALGATGEGLFAAVPGRPLHTAALHAGLCELAAIALGWLDTLPTPPDHDTDNDDEQPF